MGMHSVLQDGFDMRSAVWAPICWHALFRDAFTPSEKPHRRLFMSAMLLTNCCQWLDFLQNLLL